jgi:two-component system, NtrC family, sensor kinase
MATIQLPPPGCRSWKERPGAIRATVTMKREVQTLFMAARQIALLAELGGDLRRRVSEALVPPHYMVRLATDSDQLFEIVTTIKTEVALIELSESGPLPDLKRLRASDPDLEVILVGDAARFLPGGGVTYDTMFDVLQRPYHSAMLARRVELARDRRYLRRAEQRRERLEARMSAIMQAVPAGIVSFDEDNVIHDWNPAAASIFERSEVEVVGRKFWEITGLDAASMRGTNGRLVLGRKWEATARRRNGDPFPVEISLVAPPLSERNLVCAIFEDRTEAKRLEMELRQAQKLESVGQLSAGLAHEINTPCQYIGDHAQFLEGALEDVTRIFSSYRRLVQAAETAPINRAELAAVRKEEEDADLDYCLERLPRATQGITQGIRRVAAIVAAMKSFARTDWSEGNSVDVNELVSNVLTVAKRDLEAVADLQTDLQPVPAIVGHGGDLHQAVYHILRNAIDAVNERVKAGGERGKIAVLSRPDDFGVTLTIADTGCGIAEAIRNRVFEPFFTTKPVGKGTGQGLAVAWSIIVEQHRGRITFDSTHGRGTAFHLHLPWSPAKPTAA